MRSISVPEECYLLSFDRDEASWLALVIDDLWEHVPTIIEPLPETAGEPWYRRIDGLNSGTEGELQRFSLAFLSVFLEENQGIGAVAYCDFPEDSESLFKVLQATADGFGVSYQPTRVLALVDIQQSAPGKPAALDRLGHVLRLLDDLQQPSFARLCLTWGARSRAPQRALMRQITKGNLTSGFVKGKEAVALAIKPILAKHSYDNYLRLAPGSLHDPHLLHLSRAEDRVIACDRLEAISKMQIWSWVKDLAEAEVVTPEAKRRWLAAKAFENSCVDSNSFGGSVAALVAVCEGAASFVRTAHSTSPIVRSRLGSLQTDELMGYYDLGRLALTGDPFYRFCQRIYAFLTAGTNYDPGASRLELVEILDDSGELVLSFEFSDDLPPYLTPNFANAKGYPGFSQNSWFELRESASSPKVIRADRSLSLKLTLRE